MLPFVKHHALYFLFEFLFISVMIYPSVGSFDTVDIYICENEDATLTWQITSALNVESKVLYKGETLVASWPKGYQLIIYPPYENRLVQIGESAIKIKNATRSDSGVYKFILSLKSMTNRSEVLIDLHVIVPPTDDCIAIIAHEEDTLKAKVPESGCGIPSLIPYWKYVTQSHVSGNISILQPESRHQPRTYTACPVGKALQCFTGSPDRLCTNFTLDESWPKDEHKSWSLTEIIIPASIVPFVILVIVIILVLFLRRKRNQPKSANDLEENNALMALDSNKALTDIKRYLIKQYKTTVEVSLSPSGEENFVNVSEVYCDLEITSVRKEDLKEQSNVAFLKDILYTDKTDGNSAKNVRLTPTVILGQCGTGKSTWCKHLVHEWCNYQDDKEKNVYVGQSNIPIVGKFEILLYVPLKGKLEGSFKECLRSELFCSAANYFKYTINYISKHRESVLIIIDGLDAVIDNQAPITNLLTVKDIFPCTIVLTSRPAGLERFLGKEAIALRLFQIRGMGLDICQEYAGKVLGILNRNRHEKLIVEQFWDCMRNLQVQSLCEIPFLCLSLIYYWLDRKALSDRMIDIMFYIVECYIRRAKTRRWFLDNIDKVLDTNDFKIPTPTTKIKNKYLRVEDFLLKVMSDVANEIRKLQSETKSDVKSIENVNLKINATKDCVDLCVETGILIKIVSLKMVREPTQVAFSHVLLFDFFLALSLAIEKLNSVSEDSYTNRMLQELTTQNERAWCTVL